MSDESELFVSRLLADALRQQIATLIQERDARGPLFIRDLCRVFGLPDDASMDVIHQHATAAQAKVVTLTGLLAECYLVAGSDPDGECEERLAGHAIDAVRHLRKQCEAAQATVATLTQALRDVQWTLEGMGFGLGSEVRDRIVAAIAATRGER